MRKGVICLFLGGCVIASMMMMILSDAGRETLSLSEVAPEWPGIVFGDAKDSTLKVPDLTIPPPIPDMSRYTADSVLAQFPSPQAGIIRRASMQEIPWLAELGDSRSMKQYRRAQKEIWPTAIYVESGTYTLSSILSTLNDTSLMDRSGSDILIRAPIILAPGASLIISGEDAAEVRFSAERMAFIAGSGKLYLYRTRIVGWDEGRGEYTRFHKKDAFRPFLAMWDEGALYAVETSFLHLGYFSTKSFGVTLSASPDLREAAQGRTLKRPTGVIVGCYIEDLYYGFYSYEADDVVIYANTYANNVVYGIDPHDRSRRLIISGNTVYGTKKKHGIIVSREVNDSWIIHNQSYDNEGSGIMADRNSVRNVIAYNHVYDNTDGIVFFESPANRTYANRIESNRKSGIRIRNSYDLALVGDTVRKNGGFALEAYTDPLNGSARDVQVDPFQQMASFAIARAEIERNRSGVFKLRNVKEARFSRLKVFQTEKLFHGDGRRLPKDIQETIRFGTADVTILPP